MKTGTKVLGVSAAFLNVIYLAWLSTTVVAPFGWILFVAEALMGSLALIFIVNHWSQTRTYSNPLHKAKGSVDVFLTCVDEPIELFEKTLKATTEIAYDNKKIYVLDDGSNKATLELCKKYNVEYFARTNREHNKAGNLNFGLAQTSGEFILVIDSDQVPQPTIISDVLGHFGDDEKVALISTRQSFDVPEHDFNHDHMFYEHMQTGKNADNAAISCGSGAFYRRSALAAIGGFQTWNIVEDLYTSYILHAKGFKSIYINKAYSRGLAPTDLSTIYKQRGTWAVDTFRLFFKRSPVWFPGLTLRQRLHYFETAWIYLVSAISVPILFILPIVTVYLGVNVVSEPAQYLIYRIPSLILILVFYHILSDRYSSTSQFWAGLFPVYLKALIISLLPFKQKYTVTKKLAGVDRRDIALIAPHVILLFFAGIAASYRFLADGGMTSFLAINLMWMLLMSFWFTPIIRKGYRLE